MFEESTQYNIVMYTISKDNVLSHNYMHLSADLSFYNFQRQKLDGVIHVLFYFYTTTVDWALTLKKKLINTFDKYQKFLRTCSIKYFITFSWLITLGYKNEKTKVNKIFKYFTIMSFFSKQIIIEVLFKINKRICLSSN